jgi:probable HAF family extracellular repeat protein
VDGTPTGPATPLVPEVLTKIRIGTLPEHSQSLPLGLNENGEVVGFSVAGDRSLRAFYWREGGGMIDLGDGVANDLSDFGEIVGGTNRRAVLWEPVGTAWSLVELPPLEEPVTSGLYNDRARAIDRFGQFVAGSSSPDLGTRPDGTPDVGQVPVLWRRGPDGWDVVGLPLADRTSPHADTGIAMDVNTHGVAVGISPSAFPANPKAAIWRPGTAGYSVEALPPTNALESWALAIGEDGKVAGFVGGPDETRVAVTWTPTASGWRVDSIGPDEARDLNSAGLVIGEVSEIGQFIQEAWVWTEAGGLVSLGPGQAIGVNERNEVIGDDQVSVAVLWKLSRP